MAYEHKARYRVIRGKIYKLVGECNPNGCMAWCCRHIVVKIPKVNPDDNLYFSARGIMVKELNDNEFALLIPVKCQYLSRELKCDIYDERFTNCSRYAKCKTDWFSSPACSTMWKEVYGREAQVAISRLSKGENV